MEQYIGVKLINATPSLRTEGNISNEGYTVIYEDGYTSWSPKEVFEKAYIKYQPYRDITRVDGEHQEFQMRVIIEAEQLQNKIDKLEIFIKNNINFELISNDEQNRLKQQLLAMQYYVTILTERINNF